jgi:tetratricopeptide (TPR) repeat protein
VRSARSNLASVLGQLGRHEEALALARKTLASRLRALGPRHVDVALTRRVIAVSLLATGQLDEAAEQLAESRAVFAERLGPRTEQVVLVLLLECRLAERRGDLRAAVKIAAQARAIVVELLPPTNPLRVRATVVMAAALYNVRKYEEAIAVAQEAATAADAKQQPWIAADARFVLAQALWRKGGDRDRAIALAREAAAASETPSGKAAAAWLSRRDPSATRR